MTFVQSVVCSFCHCVSDPLYPLSSPKLPSPLVINILLFVSRSLLFFVFVCLVCQTIFNFHTPALFLSIPSQLSILFHPFGLSLSPVYKHPHSAIFNRLPSQLAGLFQVSPPCPIDPFSPVSLGSCFITCFFLSSGSCLYWLFSFYVQISLPFLY